MKCFIKDDIRYTEFEDGTLQVDGLDYHRFLKKIIIPSHIDGKPVVQIADNAFEYDDVLIEIHLPSTLKHIGKKAFNWCVKLEAVYCSSEHIIIDSHAFSCCEWMTTFSTSGTVQLIGTNAFDYCAEVEKFDTRFIGEIPAFSFSCCWQMKEFEFDGITEVRRNAFANDNNLRKLIIKQDFNFEFDFEDTIKHSIIYCFENSKFRKYSNHQLIKKH